MTMLALECATSIPKEIFELAQIYLLKKLEDVLFKYLKATLIIASLPDYVVYIDDQIYVLSWRVMLVEK